MRHLTWVYLSSRPCVIQTLDSKIIQLPHQTAQQSDNGKSHPMYFKLLSAGVLHYVVTGAAM